MIETISSFDTANETFYHGMLLGILSIVSSKYRILSNRESGLGHFDIELIPLSKDIPAFIFEIKNTKDVKKIDDLSTKALNQIEEKKYDIESYKDKIISTYSKDIREFNLSKYIAYKKLKRA